MNLRKYENMDFDFFCLQPRDDSYLGKGNLSHEKAVIKFCLENPKWRLSIQTHKYLGICKLYCFKAFADFICKPIKCSFRVFPSAAIT